MNDFTEDTSPRRGPATIPRDSSPSTWGGAIALEVHNTGSIPIQFSLTYKGELMHYNLDAGDTTSLQVDAVQGRATLDVTGA